MSTDYKASEKKEESTYKASVPKKYKITFKENRTFELHIRKSIYMFGPNSSQIVDRSVIDNPAFKQQSKYFTISEVK